MVEQGGGAPVRAHAAGCDMCNARCGSERPRAQNFLGTGIAAASFSTGETGGGGVYQLPRGHTHRLGLCDRLGLGGTSSRELLNWLQQVGS